VKTGVGYSVFLLEDSDPGGFLVPTYVKYHFCPKHRKIPWGAWGEMQGAKVQKSMDVPKYFST